MEGDQDGHLQERTVQPTHLSRLKSSRSAGEDMVGQGQRHVIRQTVTQQKKAKMTKRNKKERPQIIW